MDNLNSTMIIKVTEFIIYKLKKKKKGKYPGPDDFSGETTKVSKNN